MADYKMESKTFFDALNQGRLIGSRCLNCGHVNIPQKQICGKCHSDQSEMLEFKGTGKLAAFTVIYVPPSDMLEAGYDAKKPYCTGIVTLDEGPRISAQIIGLDLSDPSKIEIGMRLTQTSVERGPEGQQKKFLAFEPA